MGRCPLAAPQPGGRMNQPLSPPYARVQGGGGGYGGPEEDRGGCGSAEGTRVLYPMSSSHGEAGAQMLLATRRSALLNLKNFFFSILPSISPRESQ